MGVKSERLVILLTKEEKQRIARRAEKERISMGELARRALLAEIPVASPFGSASDLIQGAGLSDDAAAFRGERELSAEQAAALERLAELALANLGRANAALDHAFEEVEATKAYFARKRAAGPLAAETEPAG